MADLMFDAGADAQLTELENTPGSQAIVQALEERVFRLLARDPSDPVLRRRRFTNGLWAVTVWVGDDEMSVLWDGEDLTETVVIRYVGRLPHL